MSEQDKLLRELESVERLLRANAELRISTLDESLRAAQSLTRLRELVDDGVNPEAIRLALDVALAATAPCIREGMTVKGRLSNAIVEQAKGRLPPDHTQEDLASELGVDSRTFREWLVHWRRLKRMPAQKGRPRALRK